MGRRSKPPRSRGREVRRGTAHGRASRGLYVVAAILVVVVAMTAAAGWIGLRKRAGSGRPIDVEIPKGASDAEVVARLVAAGVVDSGGLFSTVVFFVGGTKAVPGRHFLADDLSYAELIRRLRRSPSATKIRVTLPEGWNRFDIARRLAEKRVCDDAEFLSATANPALLDELDITGSTPRTAEGWLFPATYDFPIDADAQEIVRRLVTASKQRIEKLSRAHPDGLAKLSSGLAFGPREIVTLASIVEKEAAVDDERPLIASVFLNRLREPAATAGKLQADPTARYGCLAMSKPTPGCVRLLSGQPKALAEVQHEVDNPWSTYTHAGLPPTPIANPGQRSLEAVLAPANTKYFYFVAKGGGRHTFSETLGDHDAAIKAPK